MRYVSYEEFQREVTSWTNIENTIRNMRISGRTPTIEELRSNYLIDNFVMAVIPERNEPRRVLSQG